MKKLAILGIFLFNILSGYIVSSYAYFNNQINETPARINIGSWTWSTNIINIAPSNTIDLNILIEENTLNQVIPSSGYFVYNNQLFQVTANSGYNPLWHGIPYSSSNVENWAFINLSLDWAGSTQRYKTGAVVRIGNRFFQAMHAGNTCNPLTNYGPTEPINSGKPWREIEPMEDYMFNVIPGSELRNYTSPISSYVIEK